MKTGYWEFSPQGPEWSGGEPRPQGSADYQQGTSVRAPVGPAGVSGLHQYGTLEKLMKLLNHSSARGGWPYGLIFSSLY